MTNELPRILRPEWMGAYACEALANASTGKVAGATSAGMFLLFSIRSIFITSRGELSPFNIYFNEGNSLYKEVLSGDEVNVSGDHLIFPRTGYTIELTGVEVWTPPAPAVNSTTPEEQARRMEVLLAELKREASPEKGLLPLVDAPETDETLKKVRSFVGGFSRENLTECLHAAGSLLGLGGGLTPSGDDLLAGFLLYHVRADLAAGVERPFVSGLCAALTGMAFQKTTYISASRIEAVCRGWSEALFLDVFDFLTTDEKPLTDELPARLLRFGHSSGVDTVIGFAVALGRI